jgi:hypothetical protein
VTGPDEKPRPGDSRFPGEHPRPTGALLGPLPEGLTLQSESVRIRCPRSGVACDVHQAFRVKNRGPARHIHLLVLTPTLAVSARIGGRRVLFGPPPRGAKPPDAKPPGAKRPDAKPPGAKPPAAPRRWASTGKGVRPGAEGLFPVPGRTRHRPLRRRWIEVHFPAGGTREVVLVSQSVGGFDRLSRPRTGPEVAHLLARRDDPFTYHHELRLRDRAARPRPGGRSSRISLRIDVPRGQVVAADVPLRCRVRGPRRWCRGRMEPEHRVLHVAVAEAYRFPLGGFVSLGAAFTRRGAEAWLRAGLSLRLRSRKDELALSVETDASNRASLGLVYQLFLPYTPSSHEMGGHAELGLVLDAAPAVRPAIRLGAAFSASFLRINLLVDIYPGEFGDGGGPAWRLLLGAGLGL